MIKNPKLNGTQALLMMARNWRKDSERWLTPGGNNDWVISDFEDQLDTHLFPGLFVLMVKGMITPDEFQYIGSQIRDEYVILWQKAYKITWWQKIIKWSFYG